MAATLRCYTIGTLHRPLFEAVCNWARSRANDPENLFRQWDVSWLLLPHGTLLLRRWNNAAFVAGGHHVSEPWDEGIIINRHLLI